MQLDNFEHFFSQNILKRGKNYYKTGRILLIEEQVKGSGNWSALVEGRYEEYEVDVKVNNNREITNAFCSCPYDWGGPCKHVAAVLYKIRELKTKNKPAASRSKKYVKISSVSEFLNQYEKMDPTEQQILKLLAVVWEHVSPHNLLAAHQKSGLERQNPISSWAVMETHLQIFFAKKILTKKGGNQYQLNPEYADALCDQHFSSDPDFKKIGQPLRENPFLFTSWYSVYREDRHFRDMRLARYLDDAELFESSYLSLVRTGKPNLHPQKILSQWVGEGFDREKWEAIGPNVKAFLLTEYFNITLFGLAAPDDRYIQFTEEKLDEFSKSDSTYLSMQMAELFILRGDWESVKKWTAHLDEFSRLCINGIRRLLDGDREEAVAQFDQARKESRRLAKNRQEELRGLTGIFAILAQLQPGDPKGIKRVKTHIKRIGKDYDHFGLVYLYFSGVVYLLENEKAAAEEMLQQESPLAVYRFFLFLCRYWVNDSMINPTALLAYHQRLWDEGYRWMAAQMNALVGALGYPADDNPLPEGQALYQLIPRIEEWETALNIMLEIGGSSSLKSASEDRLVWLVDFENEIVQPRHQTYGKKGWTKGRKVAFHRLMGEEVPGLTPQDKRFINAISYAEGSEIFLRRFSDAWKELVGHPLLFLEKSPSTAVQLVESKPTLIAKRTDQGFQLTFNQKIEEKGNLLIKETPTRYLYMEITDEVAKIARAFNGRTLKVPEKGETQLQEALGGLAGLVQVQSAFEDENLPRVEADSRICVHLLPVGDGFHVEPYVKPFKIVPPYVKPGQGETHLIGALDGQRTATTRDLKAEKESLKNLREQVSILKNTRLRENVWTLEDAEVCLQLLLELKPLVEQESILLEWPRGEKLRVDSVVGFDQFRLSVRDGASWFELDGELRVNEDKVLHLQELLALSEQQSQFVEISSGQFLALTQEFRDRLKSINGLVSSSKKDDKLLFHPLAAPAMDTFTEAVEDLELGQKFKESRQRLEEAFSKKFRVSKHFNAQLRPYQQEGFQWLNRCAAWGVGACLADDMGLGKTIQGLAFLTNRAKLGPALVVAPASVCRNWEAETRRFAPKLNPVLFGEGDRKAVMKEAKKGSLVIVTYDLMTREHQLFTEKKWATVILDEAQAIKNQATMRSKTAMALQGNFKMVMTGTPIENHLGELWNLFQFINPGLLGSLDSFNQRFAIPIERDKDENRREQLHRLLRPFILRRRKDEVLKELPEKTEITLNVDLSTAERDFYEALRRNALEKLTESEEQSQAGAQHLRILAEIMKLRRAACHPALADTNAGFKSSSKLELFGEIVNELLDNGHKALVFSQFVDHLKILERYLKKQKISYQYLDGSTPGKKRQKAIDAFQAGEGDIFLISLKAGGTGLNLTAADYVIHTDPWWNPAVEDQATDRVHRIGQQKPVTVYRLISQQTIEEKILKLHAQKRDLADSLLAGTNVSAKLSAKDLMKLLSEV